MKSKTLSLKTWIFYAIQLLFNQSFEKNTDLLLQIDRKKIPDPCNAKEHYQSFVRKKNTKSVKQ